MTTEEATLPDLSEAPEETQEKEKGLLTYDEETELLEVLAQKAGEPNVDEMAERAKAFEEKLKEAQGKKEPPNPPETPGQEKPSTARERAKAKAGLIKPEEKTPVPKKQAAKKDKKKMKLALAMSQAAETTPPIKPLETAAGPAPAEITSPSEPLEDKQTPTTPAEKKEGGETVLDQEEQELWTDAKEGDTTPRIGDEGFPATHPPPSVSDNYSRLSAATSLHDELSLEIQEMAGTLRTVLANIAETNTKIATVERTVQKLEEDKSHYMSSVLDRIREVERTLGNKKPETTPASSIAALGSTSLVAPSAGGEAKTEGQPVDVAALLAARKLRRKV